VVEVANSQSLTDVKKKAAKWLLEHFVRTVLVIKIDHQDNAGGESLSVSYELWRRRGTLNNEQFRQFKNIQDTFTKTTVSYDPNLQVMWKRNGESISIATLSQSGGPYPATEVCDPSDERNTMFISHRNLISKRNPYSSADGT
jgi:hypothetical protein